MDIERYRMVNEHGGVSDAVNQTTTTSPPKRSKYHIYTFLVEL